MAKLKKFDVIKTVQLNGNLLRSFSEKDQNDKKIVLNAIKENPHAFTYAGMKLRGDKDFILKNLKDSPYILLYVTDEILLDYSFVEKALKIVNDLYKDLINKAEGENVFRYLNEHSEIINSVTKRCLELLHKY